MNLINKDKVIDDIIKDCYWDYNIDSSYIKRILSSKDEREKKKLFEKIIYNSKDKLSALTLFDNQSLIKMFSDLKVTYNKKYIDRHVSVLRAILLGEKTYIEGLEWEKKSIT